MKIITYLIIGILIIGTTTAQLQVHITDKGCYKFKGYHRIYEQENRINNYCYYQGQWTQNDQILKTKNDGTWIITTELMNQLIWESQQ